MATKTRTYTVTEDRPMFGSWDVPVKTFKSYDSAVAYVERAYSVDERNGECDRCRPAIRCDATGEYV